MKQRKTKGFTLIETLASMLIIAMLSICLTAGTTAALHARSNQLFASESEILADTLNTALGDILHYASYSGKNGKNINITNQNYGIFTGRIVVKDGRFYVQDRPVTDANCTLLSLTGSGAYSGMTIRDFKMEYADNVFSGSYTIAGSRTAQEKEVTFAFRALNPPKQ